MRSRARLDTFFAELPNNPNNQGYIINYGTDKEIAERERLITNHIEFRKFDQKPYHSRQRRNITGRHRTYEALPHPAGCRKSGSVK